MGVPQHYLALGNVLLCFVALAALFSEWSQERVPYNAPPSAGRPISCTPYSTWQAYFAVQSNVLEYDYQSGAGYELLNDIFVVQALAVIATASAVVSAAFSSFALAADAFAPSGALVQEAVARGVPLNLLAFASWLVSWALYTRVLGLSDDAVNALYVDAGVGIYPLPPLPVPRVSSSYSAGFALAIITCGLSLCLAAASHFASAAPANTGRGSRSAFRLAAAVLLAIATAATAAAAIASPWCTTTGLVSTGATQWTGSTTQWVEGNPQWVYGAHGSYGLWYADFCSFASSAPSRQESWFATGPPLIPVGLECQYTPYSQIPDQPLSPMWAITLRDYNLVVLAFESLTLVAAAVGAWLLLESAAKAAAGHAAVVTVTSEWATPTNAFWALVAATLLSTCTWPIFAASYWYIMDATLAQNLQLYFSSGFTLSIIAGLLSYATVLALYLALASESATPPLADFFVAFVNDVVRRAPAAPAAPTPARADPASSPVAAAARAAALRSACLAIVLLGCGIGSLFSVWETAWIAHSTVGRMIEARYGLISSTLCSVNNWAPAAWGGNNTLSQQQKSLECYSLGTYADDPLTLVAASRAGDASATTQLMYISSSLSFVVLGVAAALVGASVSVVAASSKRATPSLVASIAAVAGFIFWPIAWGCYIAEYQVDIAYYNVQLEQLQEEYGGATTLPSRLSPQQTERLLNSRFSTQAGFSEGFALAVIANILAVVWLVHEFAVVRPALTAAAAVPDAGTVEEKAALVSAGP